MFIDESANNGVVVRMTNNINTRTLEPNIAKSYEHNLLNKMYIDTRHCCQMTATFCMKTT